MSFGIDEQQALMEAEAELQERRKAIEDEIRWLQFD